MRDVYNYQPTPDQTITVHKDGGKVWLTVNNKVIVNGVLSFHIYPLELDAKHAMMIGSALSELGVMAQNYKPHVFQNTQLGEPYSDTPSLIQPRKKWGKCIGCGCNSAYMQPDSYEADVNNDDTPVMICDECNDERAQDI